MIHAGLAFGILEQTFDGRGEINSIERLPNEAVYPGLHRMMLGFAVSMSGYDKDGYIGKHGFNLMDKCETANPRHI